MSRILYQDRPAARPIEPAPPEPRRFHAALDGYVTTPLLEQPELAGAFGVGHVDIKLETDRLGLPSFKIMGASWATIEAIRHVLPSWWTPRHGLGPLAGALPASTLVTATDGNHGRALARVARLLDLRALIFVPDALRASRVTAIEAEGADVVRLPGTYDDAVRRSALEAQQPGRILVSDTSWPGYERVPAAVIDGYSTILWELEEQLSATQRPCPDLVLVQLGVGAFGAAVIRHFRRSGAAAPPRIVGVEPTRAACVMASLAADRIVSIPGPHDSVMSGLNCGTPSLIAWPLLSHRLDAVIAIEDRPALAELRTLAGVGLSVGECAAAAVAAARELLAGPDASIHRAMLDLPPDASVLLFATDGVTDEIADAAPVRIARTAAGERSSHTDG